MNDQEEYEIKYGKAKLIKSVGPDEHGSNAQDSAALYVKNVGSTMIPARLLPDGGRALASDEEWEEINNTGDSEAMMIQGTIIEGMLFDKDGNVLETSFTGEGSSVLMIAPNFDARMNIIVNMLAQTLSEDNIGMVVSMITALAYSHMDSGDATAVQQTVIDINAANGVFISEVKQSGESKVAAPSAEMMNRMYGFGGDKK